MMIEVEGEIKKWGNSIGFRMKKNLLRNSEIRLNTKMKAILLPRQAVLGRDIWGKMKIKKKTEEIMREIDRDLDIEF
jgi:antitoxin component of MazEF toxin-antitoxin module